MTYVADDGYEYARYGDGFVRRKSSDDEWAEVSLDDVPAEAQVDPPSKPAGGDVSAEIKKG